MDDRYSTEFNGFCLYVFWYCTFVDGYDDSPAHELLRATENKIDDEGETESSRPSTHMNAAHGYDTKLFSLFIGQRTRAVRMPVEGETHAAAFTVL